MPKITALIHAQEAQDAPRLERALESLRPCDEVLVVNHARNDDIDNVARAHGATCKLAVPGVSPGTYQVDARNDWILCLLPREALNEELEAALFQWKEDEHEDAGGFALTVREEKDGNWQQLPAETRLVNRTRVNWTSELPANSAGLEVLPGALLRFSNP